MTDYPNSLFYCWLVMTDSIPTLCFIVGWSWQTLSQLFVLLMGWLWQTLHLIKVADKVNDHVWLHVRFLCEAFSTHVTLEWFLSSVQNHVTLHVLFVSKGLQTHVTSFPCFSTSSSVHAVCNREQLKVYNQPFFSYEYNKTLTNR